MCDCWWAFGFGCVALLVLATGLAWRGLPVTSVGQVDPLSSVLALLALALWSGNLSLQAFRWQLTDPLYWAPRLADKVANAEGRELTRLVGRNVRTIDIGFVLRPTPCACERGADVAVLSAWGDGQRPAGKMLKKAQEEAGVPAGVWMGRGLWALGLTSGGEVTERQLDLRYGEGRHPAVDRIAWLPLITWFAA